MRCLRPIRALLPALLLVLHATLALAANWDHAHGDATNSGYLPVATKPARGPSTTIANIGTFAPGAGPVVGPDGTVYVGNEQGVLWAFRADGSAYWHRSLSRTGEAILASPVVDTDGSIYVVGVYAYTDHRVSPAVKRSQSRLYRFLPGGGLAWSTLFPTHYPSVPQNADQGATTATPNIWHSGSDTAIMVPAVYRGLATRDVHLLAFSTNGGLLADRLVGAQVSKVFGASGTPAAWNIGCGLTLAGCLVPPVQFCPSLGSTPADPLDRLPNGAALPLPGVAIYTFPGGGTPWIVATDQTSAVVGWTFSMTGGFTEHFRRTVSGDVVALGPAMMTADGHSVVAADVMKWSTDCGGRFVPDQAPLEFYGPNAGAIGPGSQYGEGYNPAAAHTSDGRIVLVHDLGFDVLNNVTPLAHVAYPGQTLAAPAISRNYIYVSTAGSFRTYDARTLGLAAQLSWAGGGLSGPALGPSGRIYALANNILFVWPGTPQLVCQVCGPIGPIHLQASLGR